VIFQPEAEAIVKAKARRKTMRNFAFLVAILSLVSFSTAAQDYPKVEIFWGYQFTHLKPVGNANGWNASFTLNLNRWFGGTADFSGAYRTGDTVHTFMFGPVFALRKAEKVTPFAHALFGTDYQTDRRSTSGFSMAMGGGLDIKVHEGLAVRLVQADWLPLHFGPKWETKNVRVSAGLVWRF
jgi:opacity protein-like surface antigen